ncbi:unnamed protein product [Urochloa humidicola]
MVPTGAALRRTTTTGGARPDRSRSCWTRLEKELERLRADAPEWCVPGADDAPEWCVPRADAATDRFHWQAVVVGPEGSPYNGGVFSVRFEFPPGYPFVAPEVFFATKIFHPNVHPITGLVCLDILTDKKRWSPALTVDKILLIVASLLHEPVMDGGAINREAAYLYRTTSRLVYEEIARAKSWEHASASASASSPPAKSASSPPAKSASSSSEKERLRRPSSRGVSRLCCRLLRRLRFLRASG